MFTLTITACYFNLYIISTNSKTTGQHTRNETLRSTSNENILFTLNSVFRDVNATFSFELLSNNDIRWIVLTTK